MDFGFVFLVHRGGLIGSRVCMAYGLASRVQGFGVLGFRVRG